MPASRRESENAVGSYDVDVVVIAVVAVSMTSLSSADAARVDVFRHLSLLLLLLLAREERDDDDARKREAQKWHSRRLRTVVFLIGGAIAARADIARIISITIKNGENFPLKTHQKCVASSMFASSS
jgi:hypothetical protein